MSRALIVAILTAAVINCGPSDAQAEGSDAGQTSKVVSCSPPRSVLGKPSSALSACGTPCFHSTEQSGSMTIEYWTFCPAGGACKKDCPGGVIFSAKDGVLTSVSSDNPNP